MAANIDDVADIRGIVLSQFIEAADKVFDGFTFLLVVLHSGRQNIEFIVDSRIFRSDTFKGQQSAL